MALIVVLLAVALAGVLVGDRGLDFSLVWLPVELYLLTRARRDPRWLAALPLLCLLWVNTHGSILVGLGVLVVELAWSFAPERWAVRIGGYGRSPHTGAVAVALVASLVASCVTPYGPGLLVYDIGVSANGQIGQYIEEWNSPDFHSLAVALVFLVPLVVLVACIRNRRIAVLEGTLGAVLFVEALRTQRLVVYLMVVAAGLAATLPVREWNPLMRKFGGVAFAVVGILCLAAPAVPAGTVSSSLPVQAFDDLSAHPGRIFTEYTWGDYSIARHRATFVDGRTDLFEGNVLTEFFDVTDLTTNPDPVLSAYGVAYVVWAPATPLAEYLQRDPRWHVVDRTSVALVFARRR